MLRATAFIPLCFATLVGTATADPKVHFKAATTHFALGEFAAAAGEYEAAYREQPQAELLYDAAQAHRLAGNATKAFTLYRTYLQLYPDQANRDEVRAQIAHLKELIDRGNTTPATSPSGPPPTPATSQKASPA